MNVRYHSATPHLGTIWGRSTLGGQGTCTTSLLWSTVNTGVPSTLLTVMVSVLPKCSVKPSHAQAFLFIPSITLVMSLYTGTSSGGRTDNAAFSSAQAASRLSTFTTTGLAVKVALSAGMV